MRKGTWLIVAAFVLGVLFCDMLDPADPALVEQVATIEVEPSDTAVLAAH